MTQLEKNREAFQALYVNQKVILDENGEYTVQRFRHRNIDINLVLHLYSLNDITDEDSIELCKILQIKTGYPEIAGRSRANWIGKVDPKSSNCNSIAIDFLRSRSYLAPFRGYSVEQIISMGWAKIRKR